MNDVDKVELVLRRVEASRVICVDVETSGLDWKRNHIVGYVLSFGPREDDSYYLPFRHAPGGNLFGLSGPQTTTGWDNYMHPAEEELIRTFDRQDKLVFGHNLSFDLKFLSRVGYQMRPHHEDTMINAPLLDEWQGKYNLAYCAALAGVAAKKSSEITAYIRSLFPETTDKDAMGGFWRLRGDDPMAVEYAAGDGVTTWQLRDWQNPRIAADELIKVHNVESKLIPVLARMSIKGIKIDEERLDWVGNYVEGRINHLLEKFPTEFNPRSPGDVQKYCTDNGATDWPLTQKLRQPSFPESWLLTNEPGKRIVEIRKFMTLKTTFVNPMKETHMFQGRVHAEYNQLRSDEFGTVTGRLSSSNPNLQQVPKRDKELGRLFRSIFIPDEGQIYAAADYRQIEPLLLAYYSRCKVLVDGFKAVPPVDPHQAVANVTGLIRDNAKRCNQLIITGGGYKAMARKFGLTEEFSKQTFEAYHERMPEVKKLQREVSSVFKRRGYLKSLLGRRAHLNDPDKDYTGMNRILQCGNADILKSSMVRIDEYLESEGRPMDILNNIHDDLSFQFLEEARKHYDECIRIMQDFGPDAPIQLGDLPLMVDPKEGRNWAEATYGPEK